VYTLSLLTFISPERINLDSFDEDLSDSNSTIGNINSTNSSVNQTTKGSDVSSNEEQNGDKKNSFTGLKTLDF